MVLSPRIPSRYVNSQNRAVFYLLSQPKTNKFGKELFLRQDLQDKDGFVIGKEKT
jgi:hypothetical protein